MTPFDINPDNDAGHAIDQDDLIAFHLHELSPSQERALHRVLQSNPHLQSESIAIASTLHAFPKHEPAPLLDAAALDRHWQALRPSLTAYIPAASAFNLFKLQLQRWALPAAGAAVLATAVLIVALHHNQSAHSVNLATTHPYIATLPATTTPDSATASSSEFIRPSNPYRAIVNSLSQQPITPPATHLTSATAPETFPASIAPMPSPATSSATANTGTTKDPTPLIAAAPQASPTQLSTPRPTYRPHYGHTTDITLAVIGNLTPDRSFSSTAGSGSSSVVASYTQETTPSVGALASFHQQLRPWLGYRITVAYSEPTFQYVYSASPDTSSAGNIIHQHAYELSGTYVVDGPRHRRISTSAEAGAGMLALLPADSDQSTIPINNAYRPAGVFGVSAEYALSKHLAIHAAYRALLYKAPQAYPTYGAVVPPAPSNLTLSSEPVIGLTYRFRSTNAE